MSEHEIHKVNKRPKLRDTLMKEEELDKPEVTSRMQQSTFDKQYKKIV